MNGIVSFRKCTLSNDDLIKEVDRLTDQMYQIGQIPDRQIPARPDRDYDLLIGELLLRFKEINEKQSPSPSLSAEQEAREYADGKVDKNSIQFEWIGSEVWHLLYAAYLAGKASGGDAEKELDDMTVLKDYWYNRCHEAEAVIATIDADHMNSEETKEAIEKWLEVKPLPTPPVK